jgi:hypothetical protein
MSFPLSPSNNEIAIVNGIRYTYSSSKRAWKKVTVSVGSSEGGVVSLGGFAANNVLTVNTAGYIANNANLNYYTSNNTLIVTGNVVGGGVRSTSAINAPTNPIVGDIWYKTDTDVMYRYTNDGNENYWIDITGSASTESLPSYRSIVEFIATANQNTFSVNYSVDNMDVLRNGLRLSTFDYVANNGTTILFNDPCNANDIVTVINFFTTSYNTVLSFSGRPSGVSNGTIIWNTANSTLEVWKGTSWTTIA